MVPFAKKFNFEYIKSQEKSHHDSNSIEQSASTCSASRKHHETSTETDHYVRYFCDITIDSLSDEIRWNRGHEKRR